MVSKDSHIWTAENEDELLISRSHGRRVLARADCFKTVIFDFKDVETVGPAFADEIFRVFASDNPEVELSYLNANKQVEKMILHAIANRVD